MQPVFYLVTANIRKAPSTSHQKTVCNAMTISVMDAELADRFWLGDNTVMSQMKRLK
jgi:hypothetical protein